MKKLYPSFVFLCIILFFGVLHCQGAQDTIKGGSFLINMGVMPQTINNALKPYGLVDCREGACLTSILARSSATLQGAYNEMTQQVKLAWTDVNSSATDHYEIQRSEAGAGFTTRAMFFPAQQALNEGFTYKDNYTVQGTVQYRLKIITTSKTVLYSNIVKIVNQDAGLQPVLWSAWYE